MATNQQCLIEDFRGSDEETSVKRVLEIICTKTVSPVPKFFNLVIQNSNAIAGKSFNDASVYLRLSHESKETASFISSFPECGLVYTKDILNNHVLKEFQAYGVDVIEKYSDTCQPFLALLEFLRGREKHERALQKLISAAHPGTSGNKESNILAVLAHHLFSQLVPGKKYEVDEYAKRLPKECSCGCRTKICTGNTSIGSERTWHGRADIILNDTIVVTVGKEETYNAEEDEEEDAADSEPESKQIKIETYKSCDFGAEVEVSKKCENVILNQRVFEQILAEAITNGFAQVNKNKNTLSHFFIPTFGATSDHVSICLYDPESDSLLYTKEQLRLWCPGTKQNQLNVFTIIIVWVFLNFTLFTRKRPGCCN